MQKNITTKQIELSIIVPVYNAERTLKRCIESLVNQTYKNFEVLLIDDGSKDKSSYICDKYTLKYDFIHCIHIDNGGVSNARNLGIRNAMGKFISFLDSDDYLSPLWVEEMLNNYEENCLLMCGYYIVNKNQEIKENLYARKTKYIPREEFLTTMKIGGYAPWNKLFLKEIIVNNELMFPLDITLGEDKFFVWKYLHCIDGHIKYLGKCLNYYEYQVSNSLTSNIPLNYYEQCKYNFRTFYEDIKKFNLCTDKAKECFFVESFYQFEKAIIKIFDSKNIKFIKKILIVNEIMKSKEYQACIKYVKLKVNKLVYFSLKRKSCFLYYIVYKIKH